MGKLGILSLMFCTIVLLSCGKKKNVYPELEAFIGKEIIFSDKNFNTVGNKAFKDQFLLISYVDSGNCTPCSLEKMQYMKTNKILLLLMRCLDKCMSVIRYFLIHWDVLKKKMVFLIILYIKISL